ASRQVGRTPSRRRLTRPGGASAVMYQGWMLSTAPFLIHRRTTDCSTPSLRSHLLCATPLIRMSMREPPNTWSYGSESPGVDRGPLWREAARRVLDLARPASGGPPRPRPDPDPRPIRSHPSPNPSLAVLARPRPGQTQADP